MAGKRCYNSLILGLFTLKHASQKAHCSNKVSLHMRVAGVIMLRCKFQGQNNGFTACSCLPLFKKKCYCHRQNLYPFCRI